MEQRKRILEEKGEKDFTIIILIDDEIFNLIILNIYKFLVK